MTRPAKGEEWKDMDQAIPDFDPAENADILAKAEENIRTHRLRPVTLRLVDRQSHPLADQPVRIQLKRHAFQFGEQLWGLDAEARNGRWDGAYARSWRHLFTDLYNSANNLCYWTERPRNDASKTEEHQGEQRLEHFAQTVDWTVANGMTAKGHPLFWSIPKCIPDWALAYDLDTFWKFAEVRVRSMVARFRGKVSVWDAVNEALWEAAPEHLKERDWPHLERTGVMADYIEKVLVWCREENPDADYLVNDYGLIAPDDLPRTNSKGQSVTASDQRERYLRLLEELQRRGCAPDAVGLQGHTGWVPLTLLDHCLDQMGSAGIPVHITEFWAKESSLIEKGVAPERAAELTAEYVRQYLTVAFGNPNLGAFYFWGLLGSSVEMSRDGSYALKPAYHTIRTLLRETWWVDEEHHTDADGRINTRLYAGDYAVRRRLSNGQWAGSEVTLDTDSMRTVRLK